MQTMKREKNRAVYKRAREQYKMSNEIDKELSLKYCHRFGKITVDLGFVTIERVLEALIEQVMDNVFNKRHRLIGEIFFDKGWMTFKQIEEVLNILSKDGKKEKKRKKKNKMS
jgi:hypothetical protein